ncbi:UDP-glycosyltransferase UGT4-like [Bolinopsis microptera]|uniref:UDP-glycosyltransferase UGT4-like n=1 Tax=Bolinopsis microptera TaxID=2820187 RepID=UPI003079C4D8
MLGKNFIQLVLSVCLLLDSGNGAHVLFLSSVLYRQDVRIQTVMAKGLIDNEDNVTVMAPISYEDFSLLGFPIQTNFISLENLAKVQQTGLTGAETENFYDVMNYAVATCGQFYAEPEISRLLSVQHTEYDVVIVNAEFNECVLPVLIATEANFIILSTTNRVPSYIKYSLGVPEQPSFSPDQWSLNDKLSFTKRMKALFNYRKLLHKMHWWYYRSVNSIAYQTIPSHISLLDSYQRASLIMQDANLGIDLSLPTFSSVVPIGGIQCRDGSPEALPEDILKFIDEAPHGVIFVSFGTVLKPSKLSFASLMKLVNVFGRVRQRVIWVFDDLSVIELTKNVMPVKYIDQQSVLAHPKVVLFITHAGHFSRQETIYHAVPCIAFPLFNPLQFANADYIQEKKIGIKFLIDAFSEEMLINGIMEVITNPKFKNNIQQLSNQMRDTLSSPLDTTIFWIHYSIRNRGCSYLKSHSMHLYWFQYYLIDVKIFVLVSTLLVLYVVTGILRWCKNRYLQHRLQQQQSAQGQNSVNHESKKNFLNAMKNE